MNNTGNTRTFRDVHWSSLKKRNCAPTAAEIKELVEWSQNDLLLTVDVLSLRLKEQMEKIK